MRAELGYLPFHVAVLFEKPGPAPKARSFFTSSFSVRSERSSVICQSYGLLPAPIAASVS